MSEYCGTTDNDVPRSTSGSHLITYQEWKSISSTRANQGVSPGRYYQPDEISALDENKRREYFSTRSYLCNTALAVRLPARGCNPNEVKFGGPAPNQQEIEEQIARKKGRLGGNRARYPHQTRAAGSSPCYHTTTPVGNFANWSGTNRNNFIPPPPGNRAIAIKSPLPMAPSRDIVQTSHESARGPKTVRPSAPVRQARDFSGSEVHSVSSTGSMSSEARPRSWPTDDSVESIAEEIADEQASKLLHFRDSWPIRRNTSRNATAIPLVPHGRSLFTGLLYGPEVRNPHPRQLYLKGDIHTPECPEAIKKAAAECEELSHWADPWTKSLSVLLAEQEVFGGWLKERLAW